MFEEARVGVKWLFVVATGVGTRSWWLEWDKGIPFDVDGDNDEAVAPIWIDWVIIVFFGLESRRIVSSKWCRLTLCARRCGSPFDGTVVVVVIVVVVAVDTVLLYDSSRAKQRKKNLLFIHLKTFDV